MDKKNFPVPNQHLDRQYFVRDGQRTGSTIDLFPNNNIYLHCELTK